eukprot:g28747.t1
MKEHRFDREVDHQVCKPAGRYVEKKWTGLSKLGKFTAAVLEKAKPLVEAVKQKNKELEQDTELRDAVFMMDLVNGVVTTYALIGFTIPEFVIQGSDEVEVQLEKRIPRWEAGRDIDKESELGKKIQAQIEKLQEAMPQIQLICKENPKFSFEDQRECKETINMKATLFAGAACAIKGNTEELAKMIAKAEEEFKKGEASFFDTEAKKKILTKAQYDSALEKLKEKAQEPNKLSKPSREYKMGELEKKAKEETKTEETKPAAEPKPEEKKGAAETAPEGMKTGKVYLANGMLMMISFFIFRVCLYTYMAVVIYRSSEGLFTIPVLNRILFLSGYFGGAGLQYFWFAKILRGAYKTLIGGPSRPTEKLLKSDTVAEPEASSPPKELRPGTAGRIVDFYVYADPDGLGAEEVQALWPLRVTLSQGEAKTLMKGWSPHWSEYLTESEYYTSQHLGVLVRKYSWPLPFVVLELWGLQEELAQAAEHCSSQGSGDRRRLALLLPETSVPKAEHLPGKPKAPTCLAGSPQNTPQILYGNLKHMDTFNGILSGETMWNTSVVLHPDPIGRTPFACVCAWSYWPLMASQLFPSSETN